MPNFFVDEVRNYGAKGQWCHLWTDGTDDELDEFANKIGLSTDWWHLSTGITGRFYHYDLSPSKRKLAIRAGAKFVSLREWIKSRINK